MRKGRVSQNVKTYLANYFTNITDVMSLRLYFRFT